MIAKYLSWWYPSLVIRNKGNWICNPQVIFANIGNYLKKIVTNDLLTYPQLVHVNTLLCVRALRALDPFWEWTLSGFTFISSMRFQKWYVHLRGRVSTQEHFPLVGCPDDYLKEDKRWLSRVIHFFNCAHMSCAHLLACDVLFKQLRTYVNGHLRPTRTSHNDCINRSHTWLSYFWQLGAMDTNHQVVLNKQCTYVYLQTNQSSTAQ